MKLSVSLLFTILTQLISQVHADCSISGGNYYCNEVDAVVYSGVGYSGSYSDVISMDETSCTCEQQSTSISGTMSPLDEELSVHFRGPLRLLQFGVYYPSGSSNLKKRDLTEESCTTTKHVHHQHKKRAIKIIEATETVIVDQNGNLITATGTSTSTQGTDEIVSTSSTEAATSTYDPDLTVTYPTTTSTPAETTSSSSSSSSAAATTTSASSSGAWQRSSYFQPGSIDNVVVLNSLGGVNGSGIWSSCFGNSLSFCGADGVSASSESVALGDVTVDSDTEFIMFSGDTCGDSSASGDCGYYRSDIPLYHGFGGDSKIFVFEFEMPTDSSGSSGSNYDMPLIWLLNAKIPRTLQYGDASCSCWSTGCGEMDLFEILTSGESRLISHLHSGQGSNGSAQGGGGSQDYFARPTSGSIKAAAIFDNGEIHVVILDDSTEFGSSLSSDDVSSWESMTGGTLVLQ